MRLIKKDEKITIIFELSNEEDVINEIYPCKKSSKKQGQSSYISAKGCSDFKHNNKQPV